jgi:hypothetical protein
MCLALPLANAVAERVIGTLHRGCLNHLIIIDEQHQRRVLREHAVEAMKLLRATVVDGEGKTKGAS